ncbi:MAG: acyltransferase family protein [Planctomycetota bacterium]|jgi:peptidoglycan/LPS O-acetylase OafA/YrhL
MTTEKYDEYRTRRHFGSLDGLRCVAILSVIWHHTGQPFEGTWAARGFLGVDLFFVLSGFLIVTLLLRERDRSGAISLKKFYLRRTLRIFPAYYMVLALTGALFFLLGSKSLEVYLSDLPYLATYTSNWIHVEVPNLGVMWSLATEEQFYLLWPLIEVLVPRRAIGWVLALAIGVNQAVNFGLTDELWRQTFGTEPDVYILQTTFTPILLGVGLAHALHGRGGFALVWRLIGARWASVALAAATMASIALSPDDISGPSRLVTQILMTLLIGSVVVREDTALRPLLTLRPVVYLGTISYGLYLLHMFGVSTALSLGERIPALDNFLARITITTAVATVLATLSFRYFETPFLKLKERFATV